MANLKNGTLNYFLTKDLDALENRENALKEMNKMDPTYPDPNDPRFTDPAPVFTIQDNQLYRDGVAIGKIYNNKTGKVVEITETTETGFKYRDTEEDAIITKDISTSVVEKLTGLKGEVVNRPNNIIIYKAPAKLAETTSVKSDGLHVNAFNTTLKSHTFENGVGILEFNDDVTEFKFLIDQYKQVGPFSNCHQITEILLPNSLLTLNGYSFSSCSSLTSITIPNNVTSIGDHTFYYCEGLTSVTIGNSVKSIGSYAFYNCTGLTSVTIPDSVTNIVDSAFDSCRGLTSITSLAITAPTISIQTFHDVKYGGKLYVPQGSSGYDAWLNTDQYYLGYYNWTKVEQ